jgi:small-conductance mechanosensitive channel
VDIHDVFLASAGVAGALIGLLFVAISVSSERMAREKTGAQLYRVSASAALTAFTNALVVSLVGLIPGDKLGTTSVTVAIVGLLFVAAAMISLARLRAAGWRSVRDGVFLVALAATFIVQLIAGAKLIASPAASGPVNTIAIMVVVCFLVGISRAWELIGGPSIGFTHEVTSMVRDREGEADAPAEDQSGP